MAVFRAFKAVRPTAEHAADVAALPYDVMSSSEARVMVEGKPLSFLHIDRAEIDLPESVDIYSKEVYDKAASNYEKLKADGVFVKEEAPCYYIYRLIFKGRAQTGVVGCASIDDYAENVIKKHELTRADKEEDRIRHVDALDANTGPIFLTCRDDAGTLSAFTAAFIEAHEPIFDFTAEDGVRHSVWRVDGEGDKAFVEKQMDATPALYIADGHHRCASAYRVGQKRREQNPGYTGQEEFNYFLAVVFPENELAIMDYNRVVKDLNGLTEEEFLKAASEKFEVSVLMENDTRNEEALAAARPAEKGVFSMYMGGKWYCLKSRPGTYPEGDPVKSLDVSVLQENLLGPVLGIDDPRTNARISFVGGIRGLGELVRRVEEGEAVAFAVKPVAIAELMAIADAGAVMPPKSTWFEPKLRSGLFVHELS